MIQLTQAAKFLYTSYVVIFHLKLYVYKFSGYRLLVFVHAYQLSFFIAQQENTLFTTSKSMNSSEYVRPMYGKMSPPVWFSIVSLGLSMPYCCFALMAVTSH